MKLIHPVYLVMNSFLSYLILLRFSFYHTVICKLRASSVVTHILLKNTARALNYCKVPGQWWLKSIWRCMKSWYHKKPWLSQYACPISYRWSSQKLKNLRDQKEKIAAEKRKAKVKIRELKDKKFKLIDKSEQR